ncbi:MAG: ATP-grasp domain-containing protein [Pirellulales bacterium]|nr:ATP-grasp domain-containing protein [Pirellulales bacterium]
MRVLIYESVFAEGPVRDDWRALRPEARAMLASVALDLAAVPGCEVTVVAAPATELRLKGVRTIADAREAFARCEALLVICPEDDAPALALIAEARRRGVRLLNCDDELMRLCGDKRRLNAWLARHAVPVPATVDETGDQGSMIVKPRFGCGCQHTRLVTGPAPLAFAEGGRERWHCERFVEGQPASVLILCGPEVHVPLEPCRQAIRMGADGLLEYAGGSLPLCGARAARARALAMRAVGALPGPRGFVGVDLMLGDDEQGREDTVIEINPRLTTSYVGLRAAAETNLAAALLEVVAGRAPLCRFRDGAVRFTPAGEVEIAPGAAEACSSTRSCT